MTKKTNFSFRIKRGVTYDTSKITLTNVSDGYIERFNDRTIERAKALKAQQLAYYEADPTHRKKPEFSDEYYLDYAKSLEYQDIVGAFREIHKNRANRYQISDIEWAQYSYEEIIEMENAGYKIPDEVVAWAHAQQQADVTDYVVVTEGVETDDASTTTQNNSSDELSNLRAKSLQDIANIDKAEKETQQALEQYDKKSQQAKVIQDKKEDTYKESMLEIKNLTEEWQDLNTKQKNGKLSIRDQKRYNELGKLLNGSNGKLMKDIQVDHSDLDAFLGDLENLNQTVARNNALTIETIQDATDLSNMEKQFLPDKLPFVNTGIRIDGNGLSQNALYGIRVTEIADVAMKKGKDFEQINQGILLDLTSENNTKLAHFANDYTNLAEKTEENTKNVMGEDFDKPSNKEDDQESLQKKQDNNAYKVAKIFSAINSTVATAKTIAATTDLLQKQDKSEKQEKLLKKHLKKSERDVKNLNKEVNNAQEQHETNLQEEEKFLAQLETLNSVDRTQEPQLPEISETNTSETTESNNDEKSSIIAQYNIVSQKDAILNTSVIKAITESQSSTLKGQSIAKLLRGDNTNLNNSKKIAEKVAADTMFVGIGTTAKSIITTQIGTELFGAGSILASSSVYPPTIMAGLRMMATGMTLLDMGAMEFMTGTMATGTGAATLAISSNVQSVVSANNSTDKLAQQTVKENQTEINEATKSMGQDATNEIEENNSQQPVSFNTQEQQIAISSDEAPILNNKASLNEPEEEAKTTSSPNNDNNEKTNQANKTNKTQKSNTDNKTNEENDDDEKNNSTENSPEDKRQSYDVEKDFSITGSKNAIATTIKASADVEKSKANVHQKEEAYQIKFNKIQQLNKNIAKNRTLAEAANRNILEQINQQKAQVETSNLELETATNNGDEEGIVTAQANSQNAVSRLNSILGNQSDATDKFSNNIKSISDSIQGIQKEGANIKSELMDYNKKISEQLDVSQKTIVVGAGTLGVGIARKTVALITFIAGQAIVNSAITPAQIAIGVSMMLYAEGQWKYGSLENAFGYTAMATGAAGLVVHSQVKDDKATVDTNNKGNTSIINIVRSSLKSQEANVINLEKEKAAAIEEADVATSAASATANANSSQTVQTDDKEDRRLTRFNNDSMIESKKKKKKVVEVLASSRG